MKYSIFTLLWLFTCQVIKVRKKESFFLHTVVTRTHMLDKFANGSVASCCNCIACCDVSNQKCVCATLSHFGASIGMNKFCSYSCRLFVHFAFNSIKT